MANAEHVRLLKQGVEAIHDWRENNPGVRLDLALADLRGVDLGGADLNNADLRLADLRGANLKLAGLLKAVLQEANLGGADLCMADLRHVNLNAAKLQEANLTSTDLSNASLVEANLRCANLLGACLLEADLTRAALMETNCAVASLVGANLTTADLSRANAVGADFAGANLARADLGWADLSKAQLTGADLTKAVLLGTNLTRATLTDAQFNMAVCGATIFAGVDLAQARALESVRHLMPSTLGVDTLFMSNGQIPEPFLRGTGVPEVLTEFLATLLAKPAQFSTTFVSFVEADDALSERLCADLRRAGVRCWRWREDTDWPGMRMCEVDEAKRMYDRLVLIASEAALGSSAVVHEIERALQKEDALRQQGRDWRVLFPVQVDECLVNGWQHPRRDEILDRPVADFRNWRDSEAYGAALDRLLADLLAEAHV